MSDPLTTPLCALLGVRYPLVQSGMGWVSTAPLVAATACAGGFGFLAGATLSTDDLEKQITAVKELTDQPFGVNFLMEQPDADAIVETLVRHGVRAAGYNRSPSQELISRLKEAGILCIPTVGAVRHATKAVQLGADALIVQGGEGGGHTGNVATLLLVPQVVDEVDVPVIAAGGFRDGRGLIAALSLGAVGIAMGTRFLLTAESRVPQEAKMRYLRATTDDMVVTTDIDGLPQRVLRNDLVRRIEQGSSIMRLAWAVRSAAAYREVTGASLPELARSALALRRHGRLTRLQTLLAANAPMLVREALVVGNPDRGVLPTGQVAGAIDDLPTVAELVEAIISEARRVVERFHP